MENRPYRILVAEDNPAMARVIAFNLSRAGFEVVTAHDGDVAWQRLQETSVDLIITDQQMPRMEGLECCRRLRSIPRYRDTPIIMLTAKAFELDHQSLTDEVGITAIFVKPFSPSELVQFVTECLMPVA